MQLAAPNVRNHPTPALPQRRGVEDATSYGRQRDVGVSIEVNRCVNAVSLLPPLGSPERGAAAAHSDVTEGLGRRGCGEITLSVNPRNPPTVGAGFHARPALVDGRRRRTGDGAPYVARRNV